MQIQELGEFALIERILRQLGPGNSSVVVGPGDDTAVMQVSPGAVLLATCDALVEGRHFLRAQITAEQIGRRLASVNLSDIAAMGGQPRWALASFALTDGLDTSFVEACVRGLAEQLREFGASVVGGNLTGGTELVLDLTLLGESAPECVLRRAGAIPGDAILVTGDLGAAAAGRMALAGGIPGPDAQACIARHLSPVPRVTAGMAIAASRLAHAMIDISDGFAQDLGHICDASRVGGLVELDRLPIGAATRATAAALGEDAATLALAGGEDYELICIAGADAEARLVDALGRAASVPLTRVGTIVAAGEGRWLKDSSGSSLPLEQTGWQHFGPLRRSR